jgi:AraC-like DNA-binding protein
MKSSPITEFNLADMDWLHPIFSSAYFSTRRQKERYPRHQHLEYEIIIVAHGIYTAKVNNTPVRLRKNQGLILKPGDWHEDSCAPPLRYRGLKFFLRQETGVSSAKKQELLQPNISVHDQIFQANPRIFDPLFHVLEQQTPHDSPLRQLIADAVLREIFWQVLNALDNNCLSPLLRRHEPEHLMVRQLTQLFENHIHGHLSAAEMAQAFHCSRRSFEQTCRNLMNDSPARCFLRFKLKRASLLLEQTGMLIKEVADYLGFKDANHFSRVFTRHIGKPPSAIKRRS